MDNKQTKEEVQQNLIDNLFWKSCIRNDKAVAQTLWEAREIDSIFGLEETGLLDDFFHFLQVFNIWPNIEKLNSSEIKRVMVSITHFVVLYMLKVIYGIKHMDSLRELLFSDQAAMRFVGFNAHQIKYGVCNRGDHKRKNKEKTGPIPPIEKGGNNSHLYQKLKPTPKIFFISKCVCNLLIYQSFIVTQIPFLTLYSKRDRGCGARPYEKNKKNF